MTKLIFLILVSYFSSLILASSATAEEIVNFVRQQNGLQQNVKLDTNGSAVDAHDGQIFYYDNSYYLYGTSYQCGFEYSNVSAAFCGFRVYSSPDLVTWKNEGLLFNVANELWQKRCALGRAGCYRPHVIHNVKTGKFILWINSNDPETDSGYRVLTADRPTGPFQEVTPTPRLAVRYFPPGVEWKNGDHNLLVDHLGQAYVIYTVINPNPSSPQTNKRHRLVVEELNSDYTSGTGRYVELGTEDTEAPVLFQKDKIYYALYQRTCSYCGGFDKNGKGRTVHYKTAPTPLGPWSQAFDISPNACGGQVTQVLPMPHLPGSPFLFMSDLWSHLNYEGFRNQGPANYFWNWLSFNSNGQIQPIQCVEKVKTMIKSSTPPEKLHNGYTSWCDIHGGTQRAQSFIANKSGELVSLSLNLFQKKRNQNESYPNSELQISFRDGATPSGTQIQKINLAANNIPHSAQMVTVKPRFPVEGGRSYTVVLSAPQSSSGCYGILFSDANKNTQGAAWYKDFRQGQFVEEKNRDLRMEFLIR